MTGLTTNWRARLLLIGCAATLAALTLTATPHAAQARVWVSVGVPCCGYWGPGPYWGYPPPPPPYYYGPPAYYPPPPGYPAPAPTAYAPAAPAGAPTAAITYTDKPAFTNAAGQTCREYKTPDNHVGTACQQADGQWRVMN